MSSSAAVAAESRARTEFIADAQQTRRQIQTGLNTFFEVVRTGAVLLSADNEINGSEFRRFVNGLQLHERYPGLEGIGFAQCVTRAAGCGRSCAASTSTATASRSGRAASATSSARRSFSNQTDKRGKACARLRPGVGAGAGRDDGRSARQPAARHLREPDQPAGLASGSSSRVISSLFIPVYRLARPVSTVEATAAVPHGGVRLQSDRLRTSYLQDIVASTTPSIEVRRLQRTRGKL